MTVLGRLKGWAGSKIARALAVALALTWFNPFDFQKWTQFATEDFIFRALAPSYPGESAPAIWIVVADDQTLASDDVPVSWKSWPLPLFAWANVIEEASDIGARQVFIDLAFIDDRSAVETDALVRAVEYASESSDIYLLVASPETGAGRPILTELAQLSAARPNVHLVSGLKSAVRATSDRYRLQPDQLGHRSVAADMAADYCAASVEECFDPPTDTDMNLVLWWGVPQLQECGTHPAQADACAIADTTWARAVQLLITGALKGVCDVFKPDVCRSLPPEVIGEFPFRTLGLHQVASGALYDAPGPRPEAVFIGSAFSVAEDSVQTSTYGRLPGVFAHAMAYSNLVVLGSGYFRDGTPFGIPDKIYETIWVVLVIVLIALIATFVSRAKTNWKPIVAVGGYVGIFVVLLGGVLLELAVRVSPTNWIGILGSISVAELLFRGRRHASAGN